MDYIKEYQIKKYMFDTLFKVICIHITEKKHFVPPHLYFVLDCFTQSAVEIFLETFYELDSNLETSIDLVFDRNANKLKKINIGKAYYDRDFFYKSNAFFEMLPKINADITMFKNDDEEFRNLLRTLIFNFKIEIKEIKQSMKMFEKGIGNKVLLANVFYQTLFFHPCVLIKDVNFNNRFFENTRINLSRFEFHMMLIKMDRVMLNIYKGES